MGRERFLTPLRLLYIDGDEWMLLDIFRFNSDVLRRVITVPAGFSTDFNSIPRVFWRLLPPAHHAEAGVLHDAGYRGVVRMTKKEADDVFDEALKHLGVAPWKRRLMVTSVRMFGGRAYKGTANV